MSGNASYDRDPRGFFRSLVTRITSLEHRLPPSTVTIPPIPPFEPAGQVSIWAGSGGAPSGFLLCDGTSYLRADYAALFAVVGTTFGAADGTHFNVPNLKGRVVVGVDAAQSEFNNLGEVGGEKTHTTTIDEMPAHQHQEFYNSTQIAPGGGGAVGGMSSSGGSVPGIGAQQYTGLTGGDDVTPGYADPHNNLQPYMALNYIIRT